MSSRPRFAATALALTVQVWEQLGIESIDECSETGYTSCLDTIVDRITALLWIRLVAVVVHRQQKLDAGDTISEKRLCHSLFSDYSTSTICRTVLVEQQEWDTYVPDIADEAMQQLRQYVHRIISGYNEVPYHNREHAYHVVLSANKLIDLILTQPKGSTKTFGLRHDPIQFLALLFSALIHDVEHQGVPNRQLVIDRNELAVMYNDQSVAENRSIYIGFQELHQSGSYRELRALMFGPSALDGEVYHKFRTIVVNLVLNTDIASPERTQLGKSKWKEAFGDPFETVERKIIKQKQQQQLYKNSTKDRPNSNYVQGESSKSLVTSSDSNSTSSESSIDDDVNNNDDNNDGVIVTRSTGQRNLSKSTLLSIQYQSNKLQGVPDSHHHVNTGSNDTRTSPAIEMNSRRNMNDGHSHSTDHGDQVSFASQKEVNEYYGYNDDNHKSNDIADKGRDTSTTKSNAVLLNSTIFSKKHCDKPHKSEITISGIPDKQPAIGGKRRLSPNRPVAAISVQSSSEDDDSTKWVELNQTGPLSTIHVPSSSLSSQMLSSTLHQEISAESKQGETSLRGNSDTINGKDCQLDDYLINNGNGNCNYKYNTNCTGIVGDPNNVQQKQMIGFMVTNVILSSSYETNDSYESETDAFCDDTIEEQKIRTDSTSNAVHKASPLHTKGSTDERLVSPRKSNRVNRRSHPPIEKSMRSHGNKIDEIIKSPRYQRRMSTIGSAPAGLNYRKRLGIRRSMDLSGEALQLYHKSLISIPDEDDPDELKASVVLETIMMASDVAQNLQGWHQMVKWSGRLYLELRRAHLQGMGADPSVRWYENQIGFFESYLIPLARRLEDTGVFGVEGEKFGIIVESIRDRWLLDGATVTKQIMNMQVPVDLEVTTTRDEILTGSMSTDKDVRQTDYTAYQPKVHVSTIFIFALVLFVSMAVAFHMRITKLIDVGDIVNVGEWRSRYGLIGMRPIGAARFTDNGVNLHMRLRGDGNLTFYNTDGIVVGWMKGGVCSELTIEKPFCVSGLQYREDKRVFIGGKHVTSFMIVNDSTKYDEVFAEWPFLSRPRVKLIKK